MGTNHFDERFQKENIEKQNISERVRNKIKNKFDLAKKAQKEEEIGKLLQIRKSGFIELDENEEMPTQEVIKNEVSNLVREKAFSLDLPESEWKASYSLDGRYLLLHDNSVISAFDVKTLNLFYEREIENIETSVFLHNEKYCAIACDTVFIYNKNGQEIHHLLQSKNVKKMTFLPDHFLLVALHKNPFLKYFDTSLGKEVAKLYIKDSNCGAIARRDDGLVLVGGPQGILRFYSPNVNEPLCSVLVNSARISSIAVRNNNFACSTLQGTNYYDFRKMDESVYKLPKSENVALSKICAISYQNKVSTFLHGKNYVSETYKRINTIEFAPFEDILTVGDLKGLKNMIVPGAGEPNIDFHDNSPFLTKNQRKEREVRKLLEKIPSNFIGSKFIVEDEK